MNKQLVGIASGFIIVIILMMAVIYYGLDRMNKINTELNITLLEQNQKAKLVFEMREGMLNRVMSLRNMFVLKDPFEKDDERMRFYGYAHRVITARSKLESMSLTTKENKGLEDFSEHARIGTPIQNEISEHLQEDEEVHDIEPLFKKAFSAQEKAMAHLTTFLQDIESSRQQQIDSTVAAYDNVRIVMFLMGTVATIIALLTTIYVVRWNHRQMLIIHDEREKFKTLFNGSLDAVALLDEGNVIEHNPRFLELFQLPENRDLSECNIYEFSTELQENEMPSRKAWQIHMSEAVSKRSTIFEWQFQNKDKVIFYAEVGLSVVVLSNSEIIQVVMRDITERKKHEHKIQHQASHDALTGLINRREFDYKLTSSLNEAIEEDKSHALCMIDLDHFKQVNDTSGHAAGDELLIQITSLLKKKIRSSDSLARLGGDEFAILLNDCSLEKAKIIADKMRVDVENYDLVWAGVEHHVSLSIGITSITSINKSVDEILKSADLACYKAKESGRNQVCMAKTQ